MQMRGTGLCPTLNELSVLMTLRRRPKETEGELTLVAALDERISGYISIWQPDWFVHHLYVIPAVHGVGIGTALIEHSERLAAPHSLSLKCQTANAKAIGFYSALGFVETAERGTDEYGAWIRLAKT
jgi:GNAT superfamily N-acetyltransferase